MFSTLKNFHLVNGIRFDYSNATCTCCNCGKTVAAASAYADSADRTYCPDCMNGTKIASVYSLAMFHLARYLDRLDIPYEDPVDLLHGKQIRFPWTNGDVVCHEASYGGNIGRLETMGFTFDNGDVTGHLLPLEALEIILHDWNECNKELREGK